MVVVVVVVVVAAWAVELAKAVEVKRINDTSVLWKARLRRRIDDVCVAMDNSENKLCGPSAYRTSCAAHVRVKQVLTHARICGPSK